MTDADSDLEPANPNGAESDGPEDFDRFESLTRRLLRVPKDELDAKLTDHRNNGAKKPSPSTPRK